MDSLVIQENERGPYYCRSQSNELLSLSNKLQLGYGNKALIVPSGMSSISVVLNVLLSKHKKDKVHLIINNELYCDTPRLAKFLCETYTNTQLHTIDITNNDNVKKLLESHNIEKKRQDIHILYMESCSNPSGNIPDFNFLKTLKSHGYSKKLYIVVDNTWLTHVVFNPFEHGADIVVNSLTKYYSGGKCIAGAILSNNDKIYNSFLRFIKLNGLHVSPTHCKIIDEQMQHLEERIKKTSEITCQLAKKLEENDNIKVYHPSLTSNSNQTKGKLYFHKDREGNTLYPSVVTFIIPLPKDQAIQWMIDTGIDFETSFGAYNSKFCNYPKEMDGNTRCRLAIGYDDTYDAIYNKIIKKLFHNL
ncbi:Cys/Met metabolism, pyridoxal phosphate-dependent enzyme [Orpheovirus IHUMI-LCC2]|uniref:Cys/Met metabolism, pyridoxal phosphate-dependent enzyme n=1 Tax=Orpheovirus IHUMI-LCC2 TaxID=2023057 RepID=A0A2I2L687_9VIRU|nr:Cys/Met metabolism, pyridoxal phosphate-dependent enzyme [Orpheovirus IHUMI-LCC2]SNW63026.1 Cys/Met metabolism, pyridoxal phosphate-dependent enzyme [Orpheovirus IHUMI-LCC2]